MVVSYFNPRDQTGGAERIAWAEAELLALTHKVVFVTSSTPVEGVPFLQAQLAGWTRRLYQAPSPRRRNPLRLALFHLLSLFNPLAFAEALWLFIRIRPAVVHTHNLLAISPAVWLAARITGARTVHTHHDLWLLCEYAMMTDPSGRPCNEAQPICHACKALRKPKEIQLGLVSEEVFPSLWLRDRLGREGEIVPSFATTYQSHTDEPTRSASSTIAYVGGLTSHKLGALLQGFELLLADQYPNLRLAIAGSGPRASEVESAAEEDPRINYLGTLDPAARDRLLEEAAVLVIPSACPEGSPLVFFEALAAGLPVVASDIGGISELQRFGNVLLVRPGDAEALKDALETLLLDDAVMTRLRSAARRHRADASPARYAREISDVLERVSAL